MSAVKTLNKCTSQTDFAIDGKERKVSYFENLFSQCLRLSIFVVIDVFLL